MKLFGKVVNEQEDYGDSVYGGLLRLMMLSGVLFLCYLIIERFFS